MLKAIVTIILVVYLPAAAFADLFGDSKSATLETYSDYSKSNSTTTFSAGIQAAAPYDGAGPAIQLGADVRSRAGCGSLNVLGSITSLFNKEAIDGYAKGLVGSVVGSAPLALLCYTSQTLCDMYKHFRNMANATLNLRNAQCQNSMQLAENAATNIREQSRVNCIDEKMAAGDDADSAMAACRNTIDKLNIPSGGEGYSYNLVDELAKVTNMDPGQKNVAQAILGDVVVSAQYGTGSRAATPLVYERLISTYVNEYNGQLTGLVKYFQNGWRMPPIQALVNASPPDMPLHPSTLRALALADPYTSQTMIRQLASYYGLIKAYYQLEEINSQLQVLETDPKIGTKAEVDRLRNDQRRLQEQMNLINHRMEIQARYLMPTLQAMEASAENRRNTGVPRSNEDTFRYTAPFSHSPMIGQ